MLHRLLERVGLALAGRVGARAAGLIGLRASRSTLIRLVQVLQTRRSERSAYWASTTSPPGAATSTAPC
ncbi:hypothetical protein E1287_20240 [Actinomadura sp. KC06]|nr:hypothetical protein E1287_20240 [Actinomadura sp. KC06]